jgi:hypothetical protein
MKLYNERFKLSKGELRFNKEDFISYDSYKKSIEERGVNIYIMSQAEQLQVNLSNNFNSSLNSSNTPSINSTVTSSNNKNYSNPTSPNKGIKTIYSETEDFELISESQFYSDKHQFYLIDNFLSQLLSEKEIEAESMVKFMEVLYNNQNFSKNFIDSILRDRKNLYIKILNYNNLQHFANIFNTISLNLDNVSFENYDLNFAIIYIAERTFCYKKEKSLTMEENHLDSIIESFKSQKIYLSALLSKNKLYSTKSFWIDLIELKLSRRVEEQVQRIERNINELNNPKENLFSNIGAKLKNIFNAKDEPRSSRNFLKNYDSNNTQRKSIVEKVCSNEIGSILKEYIPHFANFNVDISESIDMIVELSTKYKLTKEKISYFVTFLNSSMFTIKNQLPNLVSQNEKKKFKSKSLKNNEFLPTVFAFSISYLKNSDYLNLLLLNRLFNQKVGKKIYKHILKQEIKLQTRLKIWSCILNLVIRFNI